MFNKVWIILVHFNNSFYDICVSDDIALVALNAQSVQICENIVKPFVCFFICVHGKFLVDFNKLDQLFATVVDYIIFYFSILESLFFYFET